MPSFETNSFGIQCIKNQLSIKTGLNTYLIVAQVLQQATNRISEDSQPSILNTHTDSSFQSTVSMTKSGSGISK